MAYQALYRKYRPTDFSSVKGQEHIVTTLTNQLQAGRVGHAYLFCGTRGTGKTTVAKVFAKAVNCENPGANGPCGVCAMCRAIENHSSMNVVEIDAASNNRVDDIRQVIEEVQYSPAEGKYKVYIIDEVHMLSVSAFNALLKTLEEPPSYLIFILATTEAHKIPLTILSRCQRYDFHRIPVETIASRLRELLNQEGVEAEEQALTYIARQADGALRDGLSLLEQCISFYFGQKLTYENTLKVLGAVDQTVYHEMMEALIQGNPEDLLSVVGHVVESGRDLIQFVGEFVWYLRNLLIVKTTEHVGNLLDMSRENIQELEKYAKRVELEILFRYIRILSELENHMKYDSNKRVLLEIALIKLCRPQMENDYESLLNRIQNMEKLNEELQTALANGSLTVAAEAGREPAPVKEPKETLRPSAVPEDVRLVVTNWTQILHRVDPVTKQMLADVTLSVSDAGALVMAFSQSTPAEYFRHEKSQSELVEAAAQIIGKNISLEVRFVKDQQEMNALPELRNIIKNVEIEMID